MRAARAVALAAIAVCVAAFAAQARLAAIDAQGERLAAGASVSARAHLLQAPRPGPFGAAAEIELASGPHAGARLLARLPRDARLPPHAGPGFALAVAGRFEALAEPGPGADFDHGAYLRRRGVAGELAVERVRATGRRRGGLAGAIDAIRRRAEAAIAADLGPARAGLARGMVLGADESIPRSVRDDFRDSGLAHLLAVSGQNVMLLVVLALPALAAAGLSHRARIPFLLALIALYVPLAGGGPSIQRAGVMGAATLVAMAAARPRSGWYGLALAACVTLTLNPRAIGDVGWQLSFAAVAGILLLAGRIRRRLGALPRALAEGIAMTVSATVATAPLIAHHFGTVPLVSLPANVAALPLVAPIMWLGMVRGALGQAAGGGPLGVAAGAASAAVGVALEPLVGALERLAALFADAPGGQLRLSLPGPVAVALAYGAIAAAIAVAARAARRLDARASSAWAWLRRLPRSRRTALALAVAVAGLLAVARGLGPAGPPTDLTVSFLDVGQGDATLVQHPDGGAVLFDGGPPEAGVARLLRRAGVRRLSVLVMTHPSRDHHGGLAEVVERFPIDVLLDGGDGTRDRGYRAIAARAVARGARRLVATAPLTVRAGALRIDVLSPAPRPPGPPPDDPNPRAVVAVVSSGTFDLLLSGDAESDALLGLALPDVEALKVAHHGSADDGLPELLERLRPEVASIPVGENSYGHPAPSTLAALRAAEVPTWRNDRNGTVRVAVERGEVRVTAERGGPIGPGVPWPADAVDPGP